MGSTTSATSIKNKLTYVKKQKNNIFDEPENLFNGIFDNIPAAFVSSDQPILKKRLIISKKQIKQEIQTNSTHIC